MTGTRVQQNSEMTLSNGEAALAKKSQVTVYSCTALIFVDTGITVNN
jgi:hypothetical protein